MLQLLQIVPVLELIVPFSGNRFRDITLPDDLDVGGRSLASVNHSVRELGLDDTLLPWEDVCLRVLLISLTSHANGSFGY